MEARTETTNGTVRMVGTATGLSGRAELATAIAETVSRMPERMRTAFVLSHYHGNSLEEIAGRIGIKKKEAESLLWHANHDLYHNLKPFRDKVV